MFIYIPILGFLLLFLLFLPQFLSTTVGKPFFERTLSQKIGGKISIQKLRLSWKGPQELQHISFVSPQARGTIETIYSHVPFWKLASFGDQFFLTEGAIRFPQWGSFELKDIEAEIQGQNLKASGKTEQGGSFQIEGHVANNLLTLTKPFFASIEPTEAMLASLNSTIIRSDGPISLQCAEGSRFPLSSLSWDKVFISRGVIDPGRLTCHGFPALASFFALLNHTSIVDRTAPIWFTPIRFSFDKGSLLVQRTDALIANAIHVCGWGSLELASKKIDAIFGIPADTLERSLGIRGLSSNYVLQIPIYGSLDHVQYKSEAATAKIAALAAAQQISKRTGPFSPLIDRAIRPREEPDTPPPLRPFPWER